MKTRTIATAIAIAIATATGAETLDQLAARLVSSGTVIATGNFAAVGDSIPVTDSNGQRALTEGRLPVTISTDNAGAQKLTHLVVLVYDLGQADESAHLVTTDVANYSAPATQPTPLEAAKIAVDAALGAGAWKFVSLDTSNAGTIAKIRRNSDGALLAITLAGDGSPITVDAE